MAKLNRTKADMNLVNSTIKNKKKYNSLKTNERDIILIELRKTTDQVCPFSGDTFPKNIDWTIEHFYPKGIPKYEHRELDWSNLFHCVRYANVNFVINNEIEALIYPNVYSPDEIDYVSILIFNPLTGEIEASLEDDQRAINTILRYRLNSDNLIKKRLDCYEDYFDDKERYLSKKQPFYEYFQTKH